MAATLTLHGAKQNGPRKIPRAIIEHLGGEMAFSDAVVQYREAREAHTKTVGVAAPIAHPLVEEVVNRYGAAFEVEEAPPPPDKNIRPFTNEDREKIGRLETDLKIVRDRLDAVEKALFEASEREREARVGLQAQPDPALDAIRSTLVLIDKRLEAVEDARARQPQTGG
jgi:hypothetical protein